MVTPPARAPLSATWVQGAALALLAGALVDGLLRPELGTPLDQSRVLAGVLAAWCAGAALPRRPARDGRAAWATLAALLLGALLVRAWLPALHDALVDSRLTARRLPPLLTTTLAGLLAAAPVALPLGRLASGVLAGASARGLGGFGAGLAAGAVAAPWLSHALLGHDATLLVAVCAALPGAWHLADRGAASGHASAPRLPARALAELLLLGAALALLARRLALHTELGEAGPPWWLACVAAGAALALLAPARLAPRALLLPPAVLLPALFADPRLLRALPTGGVGDDLLRAALMGLLPGLAAGACARPAARGLPWVAAPLLLALPGTLLARLVFPALAPDGVALLLGAGALGALLLARPRPRPPALALGVALAAAVWAVDLAPPGGHVPARGPARHDAAGARQNSTGDDTVPALDGRLARAWSAARARRLVHLPALLAGDVHRALLVAHDQGELARVLADDGAAEVDWLAPSAADASAASPPTGVRALPLSERLFLARDRTPYHLVLLLPDPQVRGELSRTATVEFYARVRVHLFPGGILCQWWDLAALHVDDLRAALGAAQVAFEHVALLIENPRARRGLVALVAGRDPLVLRTERLAERLAERPEARVALSAVGLGPLEIGGLLRHDTALLRLLAPPELALHDRRPLLGLRAGLRSLPRADTLLDGLRFRATSPVDPVRFVATDSVRAEPLHRELLEVRRAFEPLLEAAREAVAELGPLAPDVDAAPPGALSFVEAEALARALRVRPGWEFAAEQVQRTAAAWERDGRYDLAETLLRRALSGSPGSHPELAAALERVRAR